MERLTGAVLHVHLVKGPSRWYGKRVLEVKSAFCLSHVNQANQKASQAAEPVDNTRGIAVNQSHMTHSETTEVHSADLGSDFKLILRGNASFQSASVRLLSHLSGRCLRFLSRLDSSTATYPMLFSC